MMIRPYPDSAYSVDHDGQTRLAATARRRTRMCVSVGIVSFTVLVSAVVLSVFEVPFAGYLGLGFFAGLILLAIVCMVPTRRIRCSFCGKRMKREWINRSGREEYLVCRECRTYVYTYKVTE